MQKLPQSRLNIRKQNGEPFYPIPTEENRQKYLLYKKETEKLNRM